MALIVLSCTSSQPWQDTVRSFTASERWKGRLSARFDSDLAKRSFKNAWQSLCSETSKFFSTPTLHPSAFSFLLLLKASKQRDDIQCSFLITWLAVMHICQDCVILWSFPRPQCLYSWRKWSLSSLRDCNLLQLGCAANPHVMEKEDVKKKGLNYNGLQTFSTL